MAKIKLVTKLLLSMMATFALSSAAYSAESFLLGAAPHRHHTLQDIQKIASQNEVFAALFREAYKNGFRPLTSSWGSENYTSLRILPLTAEVSTKPVLEFESALVSEKKNLMSIYKLQDATYNKLAAMALGIFGNETEFGSSTRFKLKEQNQKLVIALKYLSGEKNLTPSRGGTQIKYLPVKITKYYSRINPDSLRVPFNAAVATVGYLAQTFEMLLNRSKNDLKFINAENVFDYIPYVYSGQMHKLLNGTNADTGATVVDNAYVVHMKQNIRKFYFMESQ